MTISTSSCHIVNCLTSAEEAAVGTQDARWFFPCQLAFVEPSYSRQGVNALLKCLRRTARRGLPSFGDQSQK